MGIRVKYLNGDVVRAGVQMLHYALLDSVNLSPRHDGVHQVVTPTASEIIVSEP